MAVILGLTSGQLAACLVSQTDVPLTLFATCPLCKVWIPNFVMHHVPGASGCFSKVCLQLPNFDLCFSVSLGASPAKRDALCSCLCPCELAVSSLRHWKPLLVFLSPFQLLFCSHLLLPAFLAVCAHTPLAVPCQLSGVTVTTPACPTKKSSEVNYNWHGSGSSHKKTRGSLKWLLFLKIKLCASFH